MASTDRTEWGREQVNGAADESSETSERSGENRDIELPHPTSIDATTATCCRNAVARERPDVTCSKGRDRMRRKVGPPDPAVLSARRTDPTRASTTNGRSPDRPLEHTAHDGVSDDAPCGAYPGAHDAQAAPVYPFPHIPAPPPGHAVGDVHATNEGEVELNSRVQYPGEGRGGEASPGQKAPVGQGRQVPVVVGEDTLRL